MDYSYLLTPFIAWLIAGTLKFLINSIRAKKLAFGLIGYGGLPSNHSAIVSSMTFLIAINEGISHPAFGASLAFSFIVILDANSLRNQIGRHAVEINKIIKSNSQNLVLRERIGHTRIEILSGVTVGFLVAWTVQHIFNY